MAAPPGSIASAIALTSQLGFSDLLLPYDDEPTLEKKLNGLCFRLDKRKGAILAERPQSAASDDPRLRLLSKGPTLSMTSTDLAFETAAGKVPREGV